MYQNVFYDKGTKVAHIWDDKEGHITFPFEPYAYKKSYNGEYTSLFGDKLEKITYFNREDPTLFESDVPETTRILVDRYTDSDIVSGGHNILFFDIEVEMESGTPDIEKAENEITSIALYFSNTKKYTVLVLDKDNSVSKTKLDDESVELVSCLTEKDLLKKFFDMYEANLPTIVTGWNCDFFDIPYMFNRTKNILGKKTALRFSPIKEHFFSPYRNRYFFGGVSILDYLTVYKKFNYTQLPSYALDAVSKKELGRGKVEYEGNLDELKKNDLKKFIEYNITDVELIVELNEKLQFIDLVQGICHVGHVPYEDYVYSSKYLEGAVLTYLKRKGIVAPNKPADRQERMAAVRESGDEKFIGAYVKDPIVGKYEWIYDLDLTSLYPSIIMSLNISPETKIGKIDNWDAEEYIKNKEKEYIVDGETVSKELVEKFFKAYNYSIASNGVLYKTDEKGVIPSILDEWFDKRVEYKDLMKKYGKEGDNQKYVFYKQRQLVQKILLNSLYGVLGLPAFRFYDIDNAEAVTLTGQTVIKKTADILNLKYNKEIGTENIDYNIYIDTDSCFFSALPLVKHRFPEIDVNDDEAMTEKIYDIANESQEFINSFYDIFSKRFFNIDHHRFEIKQEMIAKSGMWVAKKRYAQWIIADNGVRVDKLDVKGLDVVRSSFPKAFQKFMSNLLISILKGASKDEVDTLILEMKKNVHNIDIVDLAKNSSLNNLIKYRGAIDIGVINSFNKGTPAQVKGAIAYNRLLTHYKCPYKFLPFKDGDKLKWIYLKDNPFGIETLAFRGDSDPKEIKKFITTYVDRDYMFTSELDNKLQDFYSALKWQMPSASSKIINEFFDF
jgi:DNA polymerase elongation subunit (family B)